MAARGWVRTGRKVTLFALGLDGRPLLRQLLPGLDGADFALRFWPTELQAGASAVRRLARYARDASGPTGLGVADEVMVVHRGPVRTDVTFRPLRARPRAATRIPELLKRGRLAGEASVDGLRWRRTHHRAVRRSGHPGRAGRAKQRALSVGSAGPPQACRRGRGGSSRMTASAPRGFVLEAGLESAWKVAVRPGGTLDHRVLGGARWRVFWGTGDRSGAGGHVSGSLIRRSAIGSNPRSPTREHCGLRRFRSGVRLHRAATFDREGLS